MRWRSVNSIVRQTIGCPFICICVMFTTKEEQRGVIRFLVAEGVRVCCSSPGPLVCRNQGRAVWPAVLWSGFAPGQCAATCGHSHTEEVWLDSVGTPAI
ncbi:hypothetical protein AVEN_142972-1 [Araneus ventricosus]|uniref:Uncharacterized protein n=1 Tax=Araneus ventricosus TaxID=182803 RepID=A0A4Y2NPP7_ARAVE|nr:hypothetical protein AVEN_142972-1 [Araneus ventricosus]